MYLITEPEANYTILSHWVRVYILYVVHTAYMALFGSLYFQVNQLGSDRSTTTGLTHQPDPLWPRRLLRFPSLILSMNVFGQSLLLGDTFDISHNWEMSDSRKSTWLSLFINKRFALNECSSETLQNLLYFMYKKTHAVFIVFHFVQLYIFTL